MRCSKCGHAKATQLPALHPLCDRCFCAQIERRIRKNARINKLFSKGDKLIVVGPLVEYFVNSIIKGLPVKITKTDKVPKKIPKGSRLVVPDTIDDIETRFLSKIFHNKPLKKENSIQILSVITDKEAKQFAKIKKIGFRPQEKDKSILQMLDSLEKKHAETRFSLLKSINDILEK